jgi:hypothetical protein
MIELTETHRIGEIETTRIAKMDDSNFFLLPRIIEWLRRGKEPDDKALPEQKSA